MAPHPSGPGGTQRLVLADIRAKDARAECLDQFAVLRRDQGGVVPPRELAVFAMDPETLAEADQL